MFRWVPSFAIVGADHFAPAPQDQVAAGVAFLVDKVEIVRDDRLRRPPPLFAASEHNTKSQLPV
jgi:hypothetical protein